MTLFEADIISNRKAAVIAGITLLIMAICAAYAVGFVNSTLIIKGDADATLNNLLTSITIFRSGIFSWLIILLSDIVVAWALYIFLKPVDKSLSLLSAILRLTYCAILAIAILNLIYVMLISDGISMPALQADLLKAHLTLYLNAFNAIWSFGLIIFGFHLLIVSYLVIKSVFIPKILGFLILIASVSYIIIHMLHIFLPQIENTTVILENILSLPMMLGELAFSIWLIIKGGKSPNVNP